jgi:hypothetical protein
VARQHLVDPVLEVVAHRVQPDRLQKQIRAQVAAVVPVLVREVQGMVAEPVDVLRLLLWLLPAPTVS